MIKRLIRQQQQHLHEKNKLFRIMMSTTNNHTIRLLSNAPVPKQQLVVQQQHLNHDETSNSNYFDASLFEQSDGIITPPPQQQQQQQQRTNVYTLNSGVEQYIDLEKGKHTLKLIETERIIDQWSVELEKKFREILDKKKQFEKIKRGIDPSLLSRLVVNTTLKEVCLAPDHNASLLEVLITVGDKIKSALEKNGMVTDDWNSEFSIRLVSELLVPVVKINMQIAKTASNNNNNNNNNNDNSSVVEKNDLEKVFVLKHIYANKRSQHKHGALSLNPLVAPLLDAVYVAKKDANPVLPHSEQNLPESWIDSPTAVQKVVETRADLPEISNAVRTLGCTKVRKTIDCLQRVGWKINRKILQAAMVENRITEADDFDREYQAQNLTKVLKRDFNEPVKTKLSTLDYQNRVKILVAKKMVDEPKIYFSYYLDFRGRVYPKNVGLNITGDDLSRGLLQFSRPKPLGERGLYWLKVLFSNLMGHDKVSLSDRVAFTEKHMPEILRVGSMEVTKNTPSEEKSFWLKSDNPYQVLAVCYEIAGAINSGNPETFLSHVPVQQDGSCNGLQHYAAMSLDPVGGEQVNLVVRDKPGDVYTMIMVVVKDILNSYAKKEKPSETLEELVNEYIKISSSDSKVVDKTKKRAIIWEKMCILLAPALLPTVSRKLVKQTVMTSVYGVTPGGAREQMFARLTEYNSVHSSLSALQIRYGSRFLALVTLESIAQKFSGAKNIMDWLKNTAACLARFNIPVMWVSPMGLPVGQPYFELAKKQVLTNLQSVTICGPMPREERRVIMSRQIMAFPPNFVHSIDAAHMCQSALACSENNIDFAAVHDSFWTHASDTDKMNRILREKFVEMHSEDLVYKLYEDLITRYPQVVGIQKPPKRGTLDLNQVMKSDFFFH